MCKVTAGRTEQLRNGTSVRYGVSVDLSTEHIAQLMIPPYSVCIYLHLKIYQHFLKIAVVEGVFVRVDTYPIVDC